MKEAAQSQGSGLWEKIKNSFARNKMIWISFGLMAFLMVAVYLVNGIFPFFGRSILQIDLYHQYAPFHEELRSRILHGQSLFYSWESGLGKEMYAQIAYYTASPLALLMLLFNADTLPEAMAFLILLKISLAAASASLYLRRKFGRDDWTIVVFGLLYGSCAFVTAYSWDVMWLDSVALFPLLAWGVERLVRENRARDYLIALAATIFVNFYIGFIVCIVVVFYFLMELFTQLHLLRDLKQIGSRVVKFGLASLLGGGICLVLILPTALALQQTAVSQATFPAFTLYDNVYQLISAHFIGAKPVVLGRNEDFPNIYCGLLPLLLLPFYYGDRKIPLREKVLKSLFLLLLLACCCLKQLDFLIHGLHYPANLPHRFTFIYSFVLLGMGYEAFLHLKKLRLSALPVIMAGYLGLLLMSEYVIIPKFPDIDRVLDDYDLLINAVAMLLYVVLLLLLQKGKKAWVTPAFCVLMMVECFFAQVNGMQRTTDRASYVQYNKDTRQIIASLPKEETDFYRMEYRNYTIINEGAYHHYNGVSQFSSMAPGNICSLMGKLGMTSSGNSFRYDASTPLLDAMLSLRYVMVKCGGNVDPDPQPFLTDLGRTGNIALYENSRTFPLAYLADESVMDWQTSSQSPFDVQNDFAASATGIQEELFDTWALEEVNAEEMEIKSVGSGRWHYTVTNPYDLDAIPAFEARLKAPADQFLYLYVNVPNADWVDVIRGEDEDRKQLTTGSCLLAIGQVQAGEELTLRFELTNKGEFEMKYRGSGYVTVYAAGYQDEIFEQVYEKLTSTPLALTSFSDTKIVGKLDAKQDGILVTSIPAADGWEITVDQASVPVLAIGDGLVGCRVPAGSHTIQLHFEVPGLKVGVIGTLISLLLTLLFFFLEKRSWRAPVTVWEAMPFPFDEDYDEPAVDEEYYLAEDENVYSAEEEDFYSTGEEESYSDEFSESKAYPEAEDLDGGLAGEEVTAESEGYVESETIGEPQNSREILEDSGES